MQRAATGISAHATLPVALDSLAGQDYGGAVDVLCIDGGSTDATAEIAAIAARR